MFIEPLIPVWHKTFIHNMFTQATERTGMLFSCLACMCLNISAGFFIAWRIVFLSVSRLNAFHVQEENYTLCTNVSDPMFLLSPNVMPNSQRACCQITLYWYTLEICSIIMSSRQSSVLQKVLYETHIQYWLKGNVCFDIRPLILYESPWELNKKMWIGTVFKGRPGWRKRKKGDIRVEEFQMRWEPLW